MISQRGTQASVVWSYFFPLNCAKGGNGEKWYKSHEAKRRIQSHFYAIYVEDSRLMSLSVDRRGISAAHQPRCQWSETLSWTSHVTQSYCCLIANTTLLKHETKALIFRKLEHKAVWGIKKKNPILFAKSVGGYGNLRAKITKSHAGSCAVAFLQAELKTVWSVLWKVDEKSKNKTADSKLRSADYTYVNHCWPWQELPPHYDKVWNLIEIFHKGHYFGGDP